MEKLETIRKEGLEKIATCKDVNELQQLRVLYLGKKGPIQEVMKSMKDLSAEERPIFGQKVNDVKKLMSEAIQARKEVLESEEMVATESKVKKSILHSMDKNQA